MTPTRLPLDVLQRVGLQAVLLDDLSALLAHIPDGAVILDARGRILLTNSPFAELTARPPSALSGLPLSELGCPLPREAQSYEAEIRRPNRQVIPCNVHPTPLSDYWLLVFETHAALEARRLREVRDQRLHQALSRFLEGFHSQRAWQEQIQVVLDSARLLCGAECLLFYRFDGTQPRAFLDAWAGPRPDLPEAVAIRRHTPFTLWQPGAPPSHTLLRRAAQLGLQYLAIQSVGTPQAAAGLLVAAHSQAHPLPDLEQWLSLSAWMVDHMLAGHTQTQALLTTLEVARAQAAWQHTALEHVQDGVLLVDEQGIIRDANPAWCRLFGYQREEVLHRPVADFLPLSTLPDHATGEITIPHRQGEPLSVQITRLTLPGADGDQQLILVRDLTDFDRMRLEREMLHQQVLAGQMASMFAHEIKNPLHTLRLALETLVRRDDLSDPARKRLQEIMEEHRRLNKLVMEMLSLSRAPRPAQPQPVDINHLIAEVIRFFRPRAERYHVHITFNPTPSLPLVTGDREALRRVLYNLFDNALNAMRPQGKGTLGVRSSLASTPAHPQVVEIYVADSGPGIPEALRGHIFQFGVTGRENGTGLGLALCREVIQQHNGTLELISAEPSATIFRIRLPVS